MKVAPSILSANFATLGEPKGMQIGSGCSVVPSLSARVNPARAGMIQF